MDNRTENNNNNGNDGENNSNNSNDKVANYVITSNPLGDILDKALRQFARLAVENPTGSEIDKCRLLIMALAEIMLEIDDLRQAFVAKYDVLNILQGLEPEDFVDSKKIDIIKDHLLMEYLLDHMTLRTMTVKAEDAKKVNVYIDLVQELLTVLLATSLVYTDIEATKEGE